MTKIHTGEVLVDDEMEHNTSYHGSDSIDFVTKAIIAMKSHNLQ